MNVHLLWLTSLLTFKRFVALLLWYMLFSILFSMSARIETISVYQMQYAPIRSMAQVNTLIYCATEKGFLLFDTTTLMFSTINQKEQILSGKDIQAVIYNQSNAMLLAVSYGKVLLNINGVRWLPLGVIQGKPTKYATTTDATFITVGEGAVYKIDFSTQKVTLLSEHQSDIVWRDLTNPYPMPVFDPYVSRHVVVSDHIELPGTDVFAVTSEGEAVLFDRYTLEIKRSNSAVFEQSIHTILERHNVRYIVGKDMWRLFGGISQKIKIHNLSGIFTSATIVAGKIAVGTRTNGIYVLNDSSVEKNITMGNGLFDNSITLVTGSDNYLYAVSRMGATVIDTTDYSVVQKKGTDFMNISAVSATQDRVVFLKHDGLRVADAQMNIAYHLSQFPAHISKVTTIHIDGDVVYFGGQGGLAVMTLTDYSVRMMPQPSGTVTAILTDAEYIYVGTKNGFYSIDKKTASFQRYGIPDGLLSLSIESLYYTHEGIYIQTDKGFNLWTR